MLLLLFHISDGAVPPDPQPEPEAQQTPAGKKKPSRKYVIEIDGQEFIVDSAQQAQALLDRATALAKKAAEAATEQLVTKATPKAIRLGKVKPVTLKAPKLDGPDEFVEKLRAARTEIRRIYLDAAVIAELRILMALEAEQDDEEAILLSM